MPNARKVALEVLREWNRGDAYAAALIDEASQAYHLSSRDTAMVQTLVYGVLRNISLLDHWSGFLSGGRELDPASRWVLRLGIAQLLLLDMPAHASVNETVNVATRARGFVNAILRRTVRDRDELLAQVEGLEPRIRWSHPAHLVERFGRIMSAEEVNAFLAWNQQPAETYVRLNRLKPEAEERLKSIAGLKDVGQDFFQCENTPREALSQGWCYAHDPSTAMAPRLLNPQPGEDVLDACAAPGGKTALMAQLMNNQGSILATDVSAGRLKRLSSNMSRMNVTNVSAAMHDWAQPNLPEWLKNRKFDAILLDVPCSNTGVMRRRIDVRWRLEDSEFALLAASQLKLLKTALKVLKPGGRVVYSTCSIDPEENAGVVKMLQAAHPDVRIESEVSLTPLKDGIDGAYAALLKRD